MRRLINLKAIASLAALLLGGAFGVGGGCDSAGYGSLGGYGYGYGYDSGDNWSYISDYGYGSSNGDYSDAVSTYLGNFVTYD